MRAADETAVYPKKDPDDNGSNIDDNENNPVVPPENNPDNTDSDADNTDSNPNTDNTDTSPDYPDNNPESIQSPVLAQPSGNTDGQGVDPLERSQVGNESSTNRKGGLSVGGAVGIGLAGAAVLLVVAYVGKRPKE